MTWSRRLLAAGFVLAGVMHFVRAESYMGMVPDYLPAHRALVLLSGAAEVAGGLGLLVPRIRAAASWGLVVLLVVVFPANLDMALNPERHSIPEWMLWARLPLQGALIWWAYRAGGKRNA